MNLHILLGVVKDQEICKILEGAFVGMERYAEFLNHDAIQEEIKIAFIEACIDYYGVEEGHSMFNIEDIVYRFCKNNYSDAKLLVEKISEASNVRAQSKGILNEFLCYQYTDEEDNIDDGAGAGAGAGACADAVEIDPELENTSRKRALSVTDGENVEDMFAVTKNDIEQLQEAFGELGISEAEEQLHKVLSNLDISENLNSDTSKNRPKKRIKNKK